MKEAAFTQMGRPPNTRHEYCCKIAISNNVGGVKHISSTLPYALMKERRLAGEHAVADNRGGQSQGQDREESQTCRERYCV
jgi:hypothetical protein